MNKRILELAAQAYMQERLAECPAWKPNPVYDCLMKDFAPVFEIFAGLVVEECVQSVQNESMGSGDEWERGLRIAENAVKNTFK